MNVNRIEDNVLTPTYISGQKVYHTDFNKLIDVFKTGINENYKDILALENGDYDGATFIPNVSEDGVISWTNNKNLENPTERVIKGPAGTTFTPAVTPIEGGHQLSWTNDGAKPNPPSVSILDGVPDQAELDKKQNFATIKENEEIPEIVDDITLKTYFYNLRKNQTRSYQFELTPDKNQNIIAALGGYPQGYNRKESAFVYIDTPYSEAGGFVIKATLIGRNTKGNYYKIYHSTLNSNWQETPWISQEEVFKPQHTTMVVTAMSEGVGFKSDYTANEIKRHVDGGGLALLNFNAPDGSGEQSYRYETYKGGYAIFRRATTNVKDKTVSRIIITIDNNSNVDKGEEKLVVVTKDEYDSLVARVAALESAK